MKRAFLILCAALLAAFSLPPPAKEAVPVAADPQLERRAMRLAEELRCLVCQNQSLADSHAELAVDLKQQIREQVKAGKSDTQVVDYMVARYGDFVLYRPPFKASTAVLWVGPFLLLLGAVIGLFVTLARRRRKAEEQALSAVDVARADALLEGRAEAPK